MENKPEKIPIYLYKDCVCDLVKAVEFSEQINCNILITSITNPNFRREFSKEPMRQDHIRFTRSELLLEPSKWQTQVVARLSDQIDCDSIDENVRKFSESMVKQEIAFAQHVAGHGSLLIKIHGTNTSNLARIISAELTGKELCVDLLLFIATCIFQIDFLLFAFAFAFFFACEFSAGILLVEMPMVDFENPWLESSNDEPESIDTWHWWNKFRSYSDYNGRFQLALELTADLPTPDVLLRWMGETVELLIIPTSLFITNRNNYPVLPFAHKNAALKFLARTNCKFALKAPDDDDQSLHNYVNYLRFLYKENIGRNDIMAG